MVNPLGVFFLVIGLPGVIWPYKVARFEERIDAIGSERRWSEVEPADWRVTLSRAIGIVISLLGLAFLVAG